ncbi:MAG: ComEC/Rec2-related protein, partial [Bacteroidota bacterium]|nr:ComEC/Rec2-related protein [Bacteroidota bacterium]
WCFDTLLRILDAFIFRVDQLPFALVKGISISAIEMVLMYILIFLGCWLTEERKSKVLIAALVVVLGLCSFHSFKEIRNANVKEIVVYSIPKQKAIALIASNKVLTDFDSTLINDQTAMSFHVLHHWWNLGLKHNEPLKSQSFPIGNLVLFEGKRILIVDTSSSIAEVERPHGSGKVIREGFEKDISYYLSGPPLNSDLVIITGNPRFPISKLKLHVRFNEIVFDCTNNARRVKKWQEDCESLGIKYWNVSKQGAYIKDLK